MRFLDTFSFVGFSLASLILLSGNFVWHEFCFWVLGNGCRNIIPYIRKYGKHPVTGVPLKQENLIPLTFHKNSDGLCLLALLLHTF